MRGRKRKPSTPRKVSTRLPPSVKRHAHMLCALAQAKPRQVKQMIAVAEPNLLKTISECSFNVLQGRIPLTRTQKRRLSRYKTALRAIASRRVSTKQRKVLAQKGGFIGALLGTLTPMIVSALTGLAGRRGK